MSKILENIRNPMFVERVMGSYPNNTVPCEKTFFWPPSLKDSVKPALIRDFLSYSMCDLTTSGHGLLRAFILRALLESNQTTNFRLQNEYASIDECAQ